ncbi:DNA-binding LytR/AlgR family response regulator [Pedobacter cryoconitis]|uniref:LytR/AlgR family response regulator transcription factor n=1 Tax=Pedobacter cryoconitis TaxID=188932 RepID=UPI00160B9776|nr:LytTR family DNA-binding domain-containing protein [Pedobacter cryoconitis]MBB6270820.1 DNA-binding LytR/AlgR family response regulator [Pedobacter cryoconitis]
MINCIIIDDEQHAIDLLCEHVKQVQHLNLMATTTDPVKGLELIANLQNGLVFLDVQMPNLTGIELLKLIKADVRIILTTAYSEYALDGFEYAVVDYLLKPIGFPRFLKAVNRLWIKKNSDQFLSETDHYLFVKTEQKGKLLKIDQRLIVLIEGLSNYALIHLVDQPKITAYLKLKDLSEQLYDKGFYRIHKSYLISLRFLTAIEGNAVRLLNFPSSIPIGEAYKQAFFDFVKSKQLGSRREEHL